MTPQVSSGEAPMKPFLVPFQAAEYRERWRRARQLMATAKLDALLVTTEANYVYLTGHETQSWMIKSRPYIFLLPLDRDPVMITTQVAEATAQSPVADVRSYASAGFEPAAREMLEDVIRELRLTRGRVGCEFGHEQRMGLPYTEWRSLEAALEEVDWVDAAPQLWHLRIRKSPAEVAFLRRAGEINSMAFGVLLPQVKTGVSERDLYKMFAVALVEHSSERPGYLAVHSGPSSHSRVSSWPTDRVLQSGDLLYIDSGMRHRGYWSDYGRTVAIGTPTRQQIYDYNAAYRSMRAALEIVRPGVPVSELRRAAAAVLEAEGASPQPAARMGHGVGLEFTEPPSVLATENLLLEPGMVIAIEPRIDVDYGHFQAEENFVVTEMGYELLSEPQSPELPVV